jgi:hypothetical protein
MTAATAASEWQSHRHEAVRNGHWLFATQRNFDFRTGAKLERPTFAWVVYELRTLVQVGEGEALSLEGAMRLAESVSDSHAVAIAASEARR